MDKDHSEFYQILLNIKEDIGGIKADVKNLKTWNESMEPKISTLAAFMNNTLGKVSILSIALSATVTLLVGWIKNNIHI